MPEESGNPPNQHDETLRRLERRIENLEYAADPPKINGGAAA